MRFENLLRMVRTPGDTIHIINDLRGFAGSEWRVFELYRLLSPHCHVRVWSEYEVDPRWNEMLNVERIAPTKLNFPMRGVFVFVGMYYFVSRWIDFTYPRRVVLICNTYEGSPDYYKERVIQLSKGGKRQVETVFASEWIRELVHGKGAVQMSPIDLDRFKPALPKSNNSIFVVGRLSRDHRDKHHANDPALYRRLVGSGCRIRIMGGTILNDQLAGDEQIELLSLGAEDSAEFLRGLDCFVYRIAESLIEPHGRVVTEAMACGLPVVCHANGGYREFIKHGHNGFLFNSDDEAFEIIQALRNNCTLRENIALTARASMEQIYGNIARKKVLDYYLAK